MEIARDESKIYMENSSRQVAIRLLYQNCPDIDVCRRAEAMIHSNSPFESVYWDAVQRCAYNFFSNPEKKELVVHSSDAALAEGTIVGIKENDRQARKLRFEQMLQEKYDSLNDQTFQAIVKCRHCGSTEVHWEEKQTRSADEGGTLFCTCSSCHNRWVMR